MRYQTEIQFSLQTLAYADVLTLNADSRSITALRTSWALGIWDRIAGGFLLRQVGYAIMVFFNLTYLLTPWCTVLLEKLASLRLVKKFPAFYGTRRFLTALTSARHLSLSWASPIQSSYPNPTTWRSILILSSHLRLGLPSGLFPSGFPTRLTYNKKRNK